MTDDGIDLTSLRNAISATESAPGDLIDRVSVLVEQTRGFVATQTNAALTLMNWHIGRMIDVEVLKEQRAGYDREIVASLEPQLTLRFGRGFDRFSGPKHVSSTSNKRSQAG